MQRETEECSGSLMAPHLGSFSLLVPLLLINIVKRRLLLSSLDTDLRLRLGMDDPIEAEVESIVCIHCLCSCMT